jgi:hypothetical protein
MRHPFSPDYLVSCIYTIQSLQNQSNFERHCRRSFVDRKLCQYIFCSMFIGIVAQSSSGVVLQTSVVVIIYFTCIVSLYRSDPTPRKIDR